MAEKDLFLVPLLVMLLHHYSVGKEENLVLAPLLIMLLHQYSVGKEENSSNFLFTLFTFVSYQMWCSRFLVRFGGKIGILVDLATQMGTFWILVMVIIAFSFFLVSTSSFFAQEWAGVVFCSFVLLILAWPIVRVFFFFYFVCSS